jgi:hypothetical protein
MYIKQKRRKGETPKRRNIETPIEQLMTAKKEVSVAVDQRTKLEFHTRCIEYGTTMSAVMHNAIAEFMRNNPPKNKKHEGIS